MSTATMEAMISSRFLVVAGVFTLACLLGPSAQLRGADLAVGSGPGEEFTCGKGLVFCWVPPGEFLMGMPPDEENPEQTDRAREIWELTQKQASPQHEVSFENGFWVGKHEVTQEQFQQLMGVNPSENSASRAHPVENVTWNEAVEFCERLSGASPLPGGWQYALPSEAEWEYACRAGTTEPTYGNQKDIAWNGWEGTYIGHHPVGTKQANAWGIHDMLGNVGEWCADLWHFDYKAAPKDGQVWTKNGDTSLRSTRGGSYIAGKLWTADRSAFKPAEKHPTLGFRVLIRQVSP